MVIQDQRAQEPWARGWALCEEGGAPEDVLRIKVHLSFCCQEASKELLGTERWVNETMTRALNQPGHVFEPLSLPQFSSSVKWDNSTSLIEFLGGSDDLIHFSHLEQCPILNMCSLLLRKGDPVGRFRILGTIP